jgi:predicted molibdopterin-dependent oxidoreductase YjgC
MVTFRVSGDAFHHYKTAVCHPYNTPESKTIKRSTSMLQADRVVHTTCPYCGVGCQIDMHVKDGLIYRVDGRFDNDVNHGNLCVKGRFGTDFVHAPDRLQQPLWRNGRDQPLQPTTWHNALNTIAEQLQNIKAQFGSDSIAFLTSAKCSNEENYLLQKLARSVIGTNNVDHCARL